MSLTTLDEKASYALERFFDRTGWQPVVSRMPFQEMLELEADGTEEAVGEYEVHQRMVGARAFIRFLQSTGVHPSAMLKQLVAAGRALHVEPFSSMTMEESGLLMGETKASHSFRCKYLSKKIKMAGMNGCKLPGQKGEAASEAYRIVRKGNTNRRKKKVRVRQRSFLRQLKVQKS